MLNLSLQVLQAYISIFSSTLGQVQLSCFLVVQALLMGRDIYLVCTMQ